MPEIAVNPSRLPYRSVANRRRTAQRVQKRIQTGRRGVHQQRLSAANIGLDHVNLGHGEYAVRDRDSLLFDHFVDGRVYIAHRIFFPRPDRDGVYATVDTGNPDQFLTFSVVFLRRPTIFHGPPRIYHLFRGAPKSIINVQIRIPCAQSPLEWSPVSFPVVLRRPRRSLIILRPFFTSFHYFFHYHSALIMFPVPDFALFFLFSQIYFCHSIAKLSSEIEFISIFCPIQPKSCRCEIDRIF